MKRFKLRNIFKKKSRHQHQDDFINLFNNKGFGIMFWGRQSGKSHTAKKIIKNFIDNNTVNVNIFSKYNKKYIKDLSLMFAVNDIKKHELNKLVLKDSIVRTFKTCSRDMNELVFVDLVVVDEFSHTNPEFIEAVIKSYNSGMVKNVLICSSHSEGVESVIQNILTKVNNVKFSSIGGHEYLTKERLFEMKIHMHPLQYDSSFLNYFDENYYLNYANHL